MRRNRQRQWVIVVSVLVMFFSSGLSRAQDTDSVPRNTLVLPELIQEVLARNPELVAARKLGESARILAGRVTG
jgi:outer membrane protein, heavy metal efflux system